MASKQNGAPGKPGQATEPGGNAAGGIGTVEVVNGDVTVLRADGTREPLEPGTELRVGDSIETGPAASLAILLDDGTVIRLGENGLLTLDTFIFDGANAEYALALSVARGAFVIEGGEIVDLAPEGISVVTPVATATLWNGAMAGIVWPEGEESAFTLLANEDGTVGLLEVSNGSGSQLLSAIGQTVTLTSNQSAITAPTELSADDLAALYWDPNDLFDEALAPAAGPGTPGTGGTFRAGGAVEGFSFGGERVGAGESGDGLEAGLVRASFTLDESFGRGVDGLSGDGGGSILDVFDDAGGGAASSAPGGGTSGSDGDDADNPALNLNTFLNEESLVGAFFSPGGAMGPYFWSDVFPQAVFNGGPGDDSLVGGVLDDALFGKGGNDTLVGGLGNDYLEGGPGDDLLLGGSGFNSYAYHRNDGFDTIEDSNGRLGFWEDFRGSAEVRFSTADLGQGVVNVPAIKFWPVDLDVFLRPNGFGSDLVIVDLASDSPLDTGGEINNGIQILQQVFVLMSEDSDGNVFFHTITAIETFFFGDVSGRDPSAGFTFTTGETTDGRDFFVGGDEADTVDGGEGRDILYGNGGDDSLSGGAGGDFLIGGAGDDTLLGGDGGDFISGAAGNDLLNGLTGIADNDLLDGGAGGDVLSYLAALAGIRVNFLNETAIDDSGGVDTVLNFESVRGSIYSDIIVGGLEGNTIQGFGGDDLLAGSASGDALYGDGGNDTLYGGLGNDRLVGQAGADFLSGGGGADLLLGGNGADTLLGGAGNDELHGGSGRSFIDGGAGDDLISGSGELFGGTGNDRFVRSSGVIDGGEDADGADVDTVVVNGFINLSAAEAMLHAGGMTLTFGDGTTVEIAADFGLTGDRTVVRAPHSTGGTTLLNIEKVIGDGVLVGDGEGNWFQASQGNSSLFGLGGDDSLFGGAGTDQIFGGDGNDLLDGSGGNDTLFGEAGGDFYQYNPSPDTVTVILNNEVPGRDLIVDSGPAFDLAAGAFEIDAVGFKAPIAPADLEFVRSGTDLIISDLTAGDPANAGFIVENQYAPGSAIELFQFQTLPNTLFWFATPEDVDSGQFLRDLLPLIAPDSGLVIGDLIVAEDVGANGADSIAGGLGNDLIYGGAGDDTLSGGVGDDILVGGAGDDALSGGDGDDQLFGGAGDDSLRGDLGDDTLVGGAGDNTLAGGEGTDTASYASKSQSVSASLERGQALFAQATFTVTLGDGHQAPFTARVDFSIQGGTAVEGVDFFVVTPSTLVFPRTPVNAVTAEIVVNIIADDPASAAAVLADLSVSFDSASRTNLSLVSVDDPPVLEINGDSLFEIENLVGSRFADLLAGDEGANVLDGGAGNDTLMGGAGADTLDGGTGDDRLEGEEGADILDGGTGDDILEGGTGNDLYLFGRGFAADGKFGGGGEDEIADDGGDDALLIHSEGDDPFPLVELAVSRSGNDLVITDTRNKLSSLVIVAHYAGGTIEFFEFDSVPGTVFEFAAPNAATEGNDFLVAEAPGTIDGGDGRDIVWGLNSEDAGDELLGGGGGDFLFGQAGNDTLRGGAGDDTLVGGTGDDTIDGGDDTDTVSYAGARAAVTVNLGAGNATGDGSDTLIDVENVVGSRRNDALTGDDAANVLDGGDGHDTIDGGAGDDLLLGGAGNDSLIGGAGDDTLDGGNGIDTASYAAATAAISVDLSAAIDNVTGDASVGTDTLIDVENVVATGFADRVVGDDKANMLTGGAGDDTLLGGAGEDILLGGDGEDSLSGGDDDDVLFGGDGADALTGGAGEDELTGGTGADRLAGGANADLLFGGGGNDTLSGGTGADLLMGGFGEDVLQGGEDDDVLFGGGGADVLSGGGGNDKLFGDGGDDALSGGGGDDTLDGGSGNDTLDGGEGADTANYAAATAAVTVNLGLAANNATGDASVGTDTLIDVENLVGSAFADDLTGNGEANRLEGGAGDDTIEGGQGDDTLVGGAGDDVLDGGDDVDTVTYAAATAGVIVDLRFVADNATGNASVGTDTLIDVENVIGSKKGDALTGDDQANVLDGGGGDDTLIGGAGNDMLLGGDGNDSLVAGAGVDTVDGGAGTDTLDVSAGPTRINLGDAAVTVSGTVLAANQATTGGETDSVVNVENAVGSEGADVMVGGDADNLLIGNGGDDTLIGGAGVDTLEGGAGNDFLDFGAGIDTVSFAAATGGVTVDLGLAANNATGDASVGTDTLIDVENVVGSGFADDITGDAGANLLDGGAGNDTLDGGLGDDTLIGGAGNDRLIGGGGVDTVTYAAATAGVTVDLSAASATATGDASVGTDILTGVEIVIGSGHGDTMTGGDEADLLEGGGGNDILDGGAGNDTLDGGSGSDTLIGGEGDDLLLGGIQNDLFIAGVGDDTVDGGTGFNTVEVSVGAARINLSGVAVTVNGEVLAPDLATSSSGTASLANVQNATGSAEADILVGNDGENTLIGGGGNDTLIGGGGIDRLTGGDGDDVFVVESIEDLSDTILDFDPSADTLDLSVLFEGQTVTAASGHLRVRTINFGASTEIRVDADGGGDDFNFNDTITLVDTSGLDLATLLGDGTIVVS